MTCTSSKVLPLAFGLTKCFQRRRHYVICDWLVTIGVTACVVLQLVLLFMLLGSIHTLKYSHFYTYTDEVLTHTYTHTHMVNHIYIYTYIYNRYILI